MTGRRSSDPWTSIAWLVARFAGTASAAVGLFVALERRVPLVLVLGAVFPAVCAGLALTVFLGTRAVLGDLAAIRGAEPLESSDRPGPALRSAFVCAVGGWLGIVFLAQPPERLWVLFAAGLTFGAWCAGRSLRPVCARVPASARRIAEVACFSLAASALLLEIALRLAGATTSSPLLARFGDLPDQVLDRLRRAPAERYLGFPCNSTGHYDDEKRRKKPGERLVVSIGDSFSLGIVPHELHYTTVCERELGLPVQNFGIASTGPPEYLRLLVDEALPLDPDVVTIGVFVGNDLQPPRLGGENLPGFLRGWLDRQAVLLYLVPRRLAKMAEERHLLVREQPAGSAQGAEDRRAGPIEVLFPWTADPFLEQPSFSEQNFLAGEIERARSTSSLDLADLETFFSAIRSMLREVGSTPLCVVLIPDEFQVEDDVWDAVLAATSGQSLARDRAQELLVPWFSKNRVECLDLLPVFRAVPPLRDGRRHHYHLRDTHWNARGNRVAGKALAGFLRERFGVLAPR
jgi:hypothetical protein